MTGHRFDSPEKVSDFGATIHNRERTRDKSIIGRIPCLHQRYHATQEYEDRECIVMERRLAVDSQSVDVQRRGKYA